MTDVERRVRTLEKALLPFAKEAKAWSQTVKDRYRPGIVVVVGQNRGRRLCDCDDLDGYTLDQLADALRRHGWTVKDPGKATTAKVRTATSRT